MTVKPVAHFAVAEALGRDLVRYRPRLLAAVVLLLLARGLTEGVSYLLLVPLLAASGAPAVTGGLAGLQASNWPASLLGSRPSVGVIVTAFLALMLARAGLTYVSQRASAIFQTGFVEHLRRRLYQALTRASWAYLARSRQSQDMQALTSQCDVAGAATVMAVRSS